MTEKWMPQIIQMINGGDNSDSPLNNYFAENGFES